MAAEKEVYLLSKVDKKLFRQIKDGEVLVTLKAGIPVKVPEKFAVKMAQAYTYYSIVSEDEYQLIINPNKPKPDLLIVKKEFTENIPPPVLQNLDNDNISLDDLEWKNQTKPNENEILLAEEPDPIIPAIVFDPIRFLANNIPLTSEALNTLEQKDLFEICKILHLRLPVNIGKPRHIERILTEVQVRNKKEQEVSGN